MSISFLCLGDKKKKSVKKLATCRIEIINSILVMPEVLFLHASEIGFIYGKVNRDMKAGGHNRKRKIMKLEKKIV